MYRLYEQPQDRLKEHLMWRFGKHYGREFWALQDVSFEVRRGERWGIIGRNGAGKSTLLQILAGILSPTLGIVEVHGRVAALLELGSGFNPEFTGRENVYMNGGVLGLSPEELDARYEAIIAFADIGDFINQPVKLYSSGMLVRLAFAVSTHVDADILLIDEALAVGDIFFRQKCYKWLDALRERGVSVVLVSHAMMEVEQFCQKAVLLHQGKVVFQGDAPEAVKHYYLIEQQSNLNLRFAVPDVQDAPEVSQSAGTEFWPSPEAFFDLSRVSQVSSGWAHCTAVALCDARGISCRAFEQGANVSFFYEFELLRDIEVPVGGSVIQNDKGTIVHGKNTLQYDIELPLTVAKGSRVRIRHDLALEIDTGEYTFEPGFATISSYDFTNRARYSHADLYARVIRLCHLPGMGPFTVGLRSHGEPTQLLHFGVANLPGQFHIQISNGQGA